MNYKTYESLQSRKERLLNEIADRVTNLIKEEDASKYYKMPGDQHRRANTERKQYLSMNNNTKQALQQLVSLFNYYTTRITPSTSEIQIIQLPSLHGGSFKYKNFLSSKPKTPKIGLLYINSIGDDGPGAISLIHSDFEVHIDSDKKGGYVVRNTSRRFKTLVNTEKEFSKQLEDTIETIQKNEPIEGYTKLSKKEN